MSGDEVREGEGSGGKSGALKKYKVGGQEEEENRRERVGASFNLKSLRLKTEGEGDKSQPRGEACEKKTEEASNSRGCPLDIGLSKVLLISICFRSSGSISLL